MPALEAAHPNIAIELETDHRGADPDRHDFDAWIAYTGKTAAPRPISQREDTLIEETRLIGFQWGVTDASRSQLGFPA